MPDFETWSDGMMEAEQYEGDGDVQQRGVEGGGHLQGQVRGGRVQAQGGEVMGEGGEGGDTAEGGVHVQEPEVGLRA